MRVLVVDSDKALGHILSRRLQNEGHEVQVVVDGESAVREAARWEPELMVLELGLPRCDGSDVLKAVVAADPQLSVMVLTSRGSLEERLACLNHGADDFMMKPFSMDEFTARCRAIARRRLRTVEPVLRFAEIEMDLLGRRVTVTGRAVELTAKEFCLLEFLLRRRGECCGRADLLSGVWQMSPDANTNVVDVYVNYLRRKLGEQSVETVRGMGYRLRAPRKVPQRETGEGFGLTVGNLLAMPVALPA